LVKSRGNAITDRRFAVGAARIAAAAFAVLAMTASGAASASPPGATASGGSATLSAVSCLGTKWCLAVGSFTPKGHVAHSVSQVWSQGSWKVLPDPPGTGLNTMRTVTCTSRDYCLATGGQGGDKYYLAAFWNGATWTSTPGPKFEASPPSCASSKVCMTINLASIKNSGEMVEAWFGRLWRSYPTQTGVCVHNGPPCALLDVACGSTTNCVAVGDGTTEGDVLPEAATWNGTTWKIARPPDRSIRAEYTTDSCVGAFCLAVGCCTSGGHGGGVITTTYDATTGSWTSRPSGQSVHSCDWLCYPAGSLSCGSSVNCMELATYGNLAWNGTKLNAAPSVSAGKGSGLGAVSCGKSYCLAVGHRTVNGAVRTLAELWNGKSWKILATPAVG
jgi:hypothetical protein